MLLGNQLRVEVDITRSDTKVTFVIELWGNVFPRLKRSTRKSSVVQAEGTRFFQINSVSGWSEMMSHDMLRNSAFHCSSESRTTSAINDRSELPLHGSITRIIAISRIACSREST